MHRLAFILFLSVMSPGIAQSIDLNTSSYDSTTTFSRRMTPSFSISPYSFPISKLFSKDKNHLSIYGLRIPNTFLINLKVRSLTVFWAPNRKWDYTPFKTLSGGFMLPISRDIEFYYCLFKTKNQFINNYHYNRQFVSHIGFTIPIDKSLKLFQSIF